MSGRGRGRGGAAKDEAKEAAKEAPLKRKAGLFAKELPTMMYGFGDAEKPMAETVALVEELVCDYISGLVTAASTHALQRTGSCKPGTEDVVAVVRKDPARLSRAKELVNANEETRRALKALDTDEKTLERANA